MKRVIFVGIVFAGMVFFVGSVMAQNPIVYPAKGQSQQQMDKDKAEC